MAQEKLPKLTEAQVKSLATTQSFARGKCYFQDAAIDNAIRQGKELRAECQGSDYEPYEVTITLNKNGVAATACTCPYDYEGVCKHIVALLLTWVHTPQIFEIVPELNSALHDLSKEELLAIISGMVNRDPKMMREIELVKAAPRGGKPMNVAIYRKQASRAMQSEALNTILRELKSLRDTARRMAKTGDYVNAGAICHVALDEAVKGYDGMMQEIDYDGEICSVMDDLADDLGKCLKSGEADAATRWAWLATMLNAELTDIEIGGIDLAPSAGQAVLKLANNEEWENVEGLLRAKIKAASNWQRQSLVSYLSKGLAVRKQSAKANALIRELGTPEQQAYLLIDEGKFDEALKLIQKILPTAPGLVTQFADALLAAGAKQAALKLVERHGSDHHWNKDWLVKYYRTNGTQEEIIDAQFQLYLAAPSLENFKNLSVASRKLGNWNPIRTAVIKALEEKNNFSAMMDIALHESDAECALELLPKLCKSTWGTNYEFEVAKLCEKKLPAKALEIYQQLVEQQINLRNRSAYQQAIRYLKLIAKIHGARKTKDEWKKYINSIQEKYPTLRALKEEIEKAKLN